MPLTKQKALQYLQESLQSPDIDFREDQWESIDAVVNQNQKVLVAIVPPPFFLVQAVYKVANLLTKMQRSGDIKNRGSRTAPEWILTERVQKETGTLQKECRKNLGDGVVEQ